MNASGDRGVERKAILNRTGTFFPNFPEAVAAVNEYLNQWPDHPTMLDVVLTRQCLRLIENFLTIGKGMYKLVYEDTSWVAGFAGQLPPCLSNGVFTAARVTASDVSAGVIGSLQAAHKSCAAVLQPLYEAAERQCESLKVGGQTRAVAQRVTREEAYRDGDPLRLL